MNALGAAPTRGGTAPRRSCSRCAARPEGPAPPRPLRRSSPRRRGPRAGAGERAGVACRSAGGGPARPDAAPQRRRHRRQGPAAERARLRYALANDDAARRTSSSTTAGAWTRTAGAPAQPHEYVVFKRAQRARRRALRPAAEQHHRAHPAAVQRDASGAGRRERRSATLTGRLCRRPRAS